MAKRTPYTLRPLKLVIGLLLIPVAIAVTQACIALLDGYTIDTLKDIPRNTWGLILGFLLWLLLYLVMPRPMWSYVLAHELTHALWGALMGARIKGMKVSSKGGHVLLTRSNFLITLAPYFFPFYTICVIALYLITNLFYDMSLYEPAWLGWVGITWGFHFTFTLSILRTRQPDIEEHGKLFSYVIIYIFNLIGICIWIVVISDTTWTHWSTDITHRALSHYEWIWDHLVAGADHLYQRYWIQSR